MKVVIDKNNQASISIKSLPKCKSCEREVESGNYVCSITQFVTCRQCEIEGKYPCKPHASLLKIQSGSMFHSHRKIKLISIEQNL